MSRKASTRVCQAEDNTCVFFLSRHCFLLETKYYAFEPFLEKLQSSTYVLTSNEVTLILENLNLSLSLEEPCLFCCIISWGEENFACQGKQRFIKDLNTGLSVSKDK